MEIKNKEEQKQDNEKKKKAGIIIGVVGVTAAVAAAIGFGLKGCAPDGSSSGKSLVVTYLTEEDVQNFQSGSFSALQGSTIGELKRRFPSVEGYVIEGLYRDADCSEGSRFNDSDVLNEDTEVYIKFEEVTITLKFHGDRNSEDTTFPDITIKYYDNLKNFHLPTPSAYSTREGKYTFKEWTTKDRLSLDLSSGIGKDLFNIDADGEIDLYADFDFTENLKYSLTYPSGISVQSNGSELDSGSTIYAGDKLTISAGDMGDWIINQISVNGTAFVLGETYDVGGDVKIEITACEHRYLDLDYNGNSYVVRGEKDGANETNIVIPDTYYDGVTKITDIASGAFSYKDIETLTIGENIEKIGGSAFRDCGYLREINWNAVSVQDFSEYVFSDAGSSGDGIVVKFGDKVQKIPQNCFYSEWWDENSGAEGDYGWNYNAAKVLEVYIGDDVTAIGSSAFKRCYMLQKVYLGKNAVCEEDSFGNCENITELHYGGSAKQWIDRSFGKRFGLSEYDLYIEGELLTDYTFTANIIDYAFEGCKSLKNVVISDGVKSIGNHAFYNCYALTSVTIGKNVDTIGSSAFYNCQSLTNIVWNAVNVSNFSSYETFYNMGTAEADTFVAVTFGDDVQQIPQSLFAGSTRLKYVVLGSGIKELGSAFENCNNLSHIFYHGNKAQWGQLQSGLAAKNATVYYYSANDPYASQPDDPDNYWHYNEQTAAPSVWARQGGGE